MDGDQQRNVVDDRKRNYYNNGDIDYHGNENSNEINDIGDNRNEVHDLVEIYGDNSICEEIHVIEEVANDDVLDVIDIDDHIDDDHMEENHDFIDDNDGYDLDIRWSSHNRLHITRL